jgi:hypothetical protein
VLFLGQAVGWPYPRGGAGRLTEALVGEHSLHRGGHVRRFPGRALGTSDLAHAHIGEERVMAELTQLETKLAEVMGLAQAAKDSTEKVKKLVDDDDVRQTLDRMKAEAAETAQRCEHLARELEGKKTALTKKARETKAEAREMMSTYLSEDVDALDGLEFLLMAEAGELGHVEIIGAMNEQAGDERIRELVEWVRPIQERHFRDTREASLKLAKSEDPLAVA